jgi:hypothetical protein
MWNLGWGGGVFCEKMILIPSCINGELLKLYICVPKRGFLSDVSGHSIIVLSLVSV